MEGHGASLLMELPPLATVAAAFLLGVGMVQREQEAAAERPVDPRRWSTILLLLVASLAHIPVIPEHLHEAPYMGVLFVLFTLTAFGLAALLAARPAAVLSPVAAALCAAAVLAYTATRVVAFPQLGDDVGNWTEPLGVVSVVAELGVVLLGTVGVRRTDVVSSV